MNKRLVLIAQRRQMLLKKIAVQRMDIAELSRRWQKPLALADTGLKAVHFIRKHPALVSGSVAAFMIWRRKGMIGLAQEGWRLLSLYPASLALGLEYLSLANRPVKEERDTKAGR